MVFRYDSDWLRDSRDRIEPSGGVNTLYVRITLKCILSHKRG